MEICPSLCMSVKNRQSMVQCPKKRKEGSEYCGIHARAKKIIRIDTLGEVVELANIKEKEIYSNLTILQLSEILDILRNFPVISNAPDEVINQIDFTLKYFNIKGGDRCTNLSKVYEIYSRLQVFDTPHMAPLLVKMQSLIRRWSVLRRKKVNNQEDFATLALMYEIPSEYYVQYPEGDFVWGFDYRSLSGLLKNSNDTPKNPFSMKEFNMSILNPILNRIKQNLDKNQKSVEYEKPDLTPEQKYTQLLVKVFQAFDLLGQYTDTAWFNDLNLSQLKNLYKGAEDMFNYRAELTPAMKKEFVKNGVVFNKLISELPYLQEKHKRFLQEEILNEFYRFAIEGVNEEVKKTGINLMLSALVEVSMDAAIALPHLVQSTF